MSVEHQTEQVGDGSEVAESVQLLTISAKNMACGEYKISGCCFWTCKLARFHLFPLHIVSCIYILFYVAHRQLLKMSFSNNFYLSLGGHSAVEFTADTTSVGSNVWNGNQAWFWGTQLLHHHLLFPANHPGASTRAAERGLTRSWMTEQRHASRLWLVASVWSCVFF